MKNFFACGRLSGLFVMTVFAQQNPPSPEEQEKKLAEFIQKEVDRWEMTLKLEDWQVFYVDSILNHDYRAMQEEMNSLSSAKVSNFDIYTKTSDKWAENIYVAFRKVLNSISGRNISRAVRPATGRRVKKERQRWKSLPPNFRKMIKFAGIFS